MATKFGEEIKKKRLEKGLTQKELSENICTQATVSNLENGASVPTISILLKLADRLNIEFSDISDYTLDNDSGNNRIFKEVRDLCSKALHNKAYELLKSSIELDKLETIYEKKLYYYFMGITSLMGEKSQTDVIYYFNQLLTGESDNSIDFIDVSAMNGIGIAYSLQDEDEKALTYFEKSLDQLDELFSLIDTINDSPEIAKTYYNSAKFYSKIGEYSKAVNLCSLGIELLNKEGLAYHLDFLFYEKAFNLMKLNEKNDSAKFYLRAMVMADINDNEILMEIIKNNVLEYDIEEYKYY